MQDALRVTVVQSTDELLEHALGDVFLKLAPLAHVVQEIAACCNLYHEENVLLSFEEFKEAHDVLMSGLLEDDDFVENFAPL